MARDTALPGQLSDAMKQFYRQISRRYALSTHHLRLLTCACESHDRMTQAAALIAEEGLTTVDRHGQTRPHPAVAIERDSRYRFRSDAPGVGVE